MRAVIVAGFGMIPPGLIEALDNADVTTSVFEAEPKQGHGPAEPTFKGKRVAQWKLDSRSHQRHHRKARR